MRSLKKSDAKRSLKIPDSVFGVIMLLPAVVVLCTAVALPILKGIYVSFCHYGLKNLDDPTWNNFENYISVFKNGEIFQYFRTTILFVVLVVSIQYVIALAAAMLLNSRVRGKGLFRGLMLIPWTIPSVVVAITFRWLYHPQFGVINYLLARIGITDSMNIAWTQYPVLAMTLVVTAVIWRQLPYMTIMILSGLQSIDHSLEESARVDGASELQVFRHIVLPSIRPVTSTAIWVAVMNNFQMFTIVYNITGGGPGTSTTTLGIAVYKAAFQSFDFGKASAMGVLWLVVLFAITLVKNKVVEKHEIDYQ